MFLEMIYWEMGEDHVELLLDDSINITGSSDSSYARPSCSSVSWHSPLVVESYIDKYKWPQRQPAAVANGRTGKLVRHKNPTRF